MEPKFTLSDFLKRFSTEEKCLEEIKNVRYPQGISCRVCKEITSHYKIKGRRGYACQNCGSHVYPLANTVFEKSVVPLRDWFYAMFLMIKTKSGISAKQLEREIGVTYKTAWRMFHQIRHLMEQDKDIILSGDIEIDETYVGGKGGNRMKVWHGNEKPKEVVMGLVERKGRAVVKHIEGSGKWALLEPIQKYANMQSRIFTDENQGYYQLKKYGFTHYSINHSERFRRGDVHTQSAENLWSHLKRGIYGVYRHVSKKHLQKYVDEFTFRYNNRKSNGQMFDILLQRVASRMQGS